MSELSVVLCDMIDCRRGCLLKRSLKGATSWKLSRDQNCAPLQRGRGEVRLRALAHCLPLMSSIKWWNLYMSKWEAVGWWSSQVQSLTALTPDTRKRCNDQISLWLMLEMSQCLNPVVGKTCRQSVFGYVQTLLFFTFNSILEAMVIPCFWFWELQLEHVPTSWQKHPLCHPKATSMAGNIPISH